VWQAHLRSQRLEKLIRVNAGGIADAMLRPNISTLLFMHAHMLFDTNLPAKKKRIS